MLTTALRISGYWRTFNSLKARSPNSRMNRLTTSASTGFLMKRSVNFMGFFSRSAARGEGRWDARRSAARSTIQATVISGGSSTIFGRGIRIRGRLDAVVDGDLGIVAQLQQPAG